MRHPIDHLRLLSLVLMATLFVLHSAPANGETPSGTGGQGWQTIGLMRIGESDP